MKMQSKWAAAIAALCLGGTPQAAVVNLGNGSVYAPTGLQTSASKTYFAHATAVRSALPVPEPSSFALTALGLLVAGLAHRRRRG